ncbi:hypothetical protein [Actinosynnema sp. NPDC023587]|uniref:hypothetical protein n=1 Tax=Actinosynnema sp. NPDC023587 TaxID=3154695 RepID=UPI0033F21795
MTTVGLTLAEDVPVVLRGSTGGRLHLALGDEVEIVLERSEAGARTPTRRRAPRGARSN